MIQGLDYSYDWKNVQISSLKPPYEFVMRYLTFSADGRDAKRIYKPECDALRAAGIIVGLNWEYKIGDQKRGADGGYIDALEAVDQARALGYPSGGAIYFSTDFEPTASDWPLIDAYLRNCRWICNDSGYKLGQYGNYAALKRSFDLNLIETGWQTYAWSYGAWEGRAALRQVKNHVVVAGGTVDLDEMHGNAYLWDNC